jgi:hypothetical protein
MSKPLSGRELFGRMRDKRIEIEDNIAKRVKSERAKALEAQARQNVKDARQAETDEAVAAEIERLQEEEE